MPDELVVWLLASIAYFIVAIIVVTQAVPREQRVFASILAVGLFVSLNVLVGVAFLVKGVVEIFKTGF